MLNGSVEGAATAAPPAAPLLGTFYRVASAGASGAFAGHAGSLAGYGMGGWRFVVPVEGMRLTDRTTGVELAYRGGAWTSGVTRASEVVIDGSKVLGRAALRLPIQREARRSIRRRGSGLRTSLPRCERMA